MLIVVTGMLRLSGEYPIINGICFASKILCGASCLLYTLLIIGKIQKNAIIKTTLCILLYTAVITISTLSFHLPNGVIDVLLWPLLSLVFYDSSKRGDEYKFIKRTILFFYALVILGCTIIVKWRASGITGNGGVVYNAYFCLTLLPLVLKYHPKILGKILIFVPIIMLLLTAKRTGLLIAVIGCALYYVADVLILESSTKKIKKYAKYFVLAIVAITIIYFAQKTEIDKAISRFNSLSEDEGSGRLTIWRTVLDSFKNSAIVRQIFGHGTHSVLYELKPGGIERYAHNSFLEYLYDYGIIGFTLIVSYVAMLIARIKDYVKQKSSNLPVLTYTLTITVLLSLFSYYFEQSYIILPVSMTIGIILGEEKERLALKNRNTHDVEPENSKKDSETNEAPQK